MEKDCNEKPSSCGLYGKKIVLKNLSWDCMENLL